MIKSTIKRILQHLLGPKTYLFVFSIFIIKKLPFDKKEKDFLKFLELLPQTKGYILDIGANIGVMSYYLSKRRPASQIIAFEPLAINYTNLEKLIAKYNLHNITIEKCAVGNYNGEIEMVLPVVNKVWMHGLSHVMHQSIDTFNNGTFFKVPIKTLDTIMELYDASNKVLGLKIDIENFEFYAFEGAQNLLKQHQPIIYAELWEGENREKTFQLLQELGYQINIVEKGKLVNFIGQKTQNFIFIPLSSTHHAHHS